MTPKDWLKLNFYCFQRQAANKGCCVARFIWCTSSRAAKIDVTLARVIESAYRANPSQLLKQRRWRRKESQLGERCETDKKLASKLGDNDDGKIIGERPIDWR